MSSDDPKRPHRAMLAEYYGSSSSSGPAPTRDAGANADKDAGAAQDPLNINGSGFNADFFTQKLIAEASLSQLMSQENEVVRQIGSLDSDMQTLVYENYNKFIAATDTIKKMRVDFR